MSDVEEVQQITFVTLIVSQVLLIGLWAHGVKLVSRQPKILQKLNLGILSTYIVINIFRSTQLISCLYCFMFNLMMHAIRFLEPLTKCQFFISSSSSLYCTFFVTSIEVISLVKLRAITVMDRQSTRCYTIIALLLMAARFVACLTVTFFIRADTSSGICLRNTPSEITISTILVMLSQTFIAGGFAYELYYFATSMKLSEKFSTILQSSTIYPIINAIVMLVMVIWQFVGVPPKWIPINFLVVFLRLLFFSRSVCA